MKQLKITFTLVAILSSLFTFSSYAQNKASVNEALKAHSNVSKYLNNTGGTVLILASGAAVIVPSILTVKDYLKYKKSLGFYASHETASKGFAQKNPAKANIHNNNAWGYKKSQVKLKTAFKKTLLKRFVVKSIGIIGLVIGYSIMDVEIVEEDILRQIDGPNSSDIFRIQNQNTLRAIFTISPEARELVVAIEKSTK